MTVISVIAIVIGLLYAYSDQGWKLFYQSYSRGLSQVKAKIAIRILQEDLREANKKRLTIGRGLTFGIPFPDDAESSTPYIYFTKPVFNEGTGDVTGYDYVLYYFAKPKQSTEAKLESIKKPKEQEQYSILKSIRFISQSKFYTEDEEKFWPYLPPLLELRKSTLPEDKIFLDSLKGDTEEGQGNTQNKTEEIFVDHFASLKKESKNIPVSGNFTAVALTDPFTREQANIYFGEDYKTAKPVKIKVLLEESPFLFGLMAAMSEFEVAVVPRN